MLMYFLLCSLLAEPEHCRGLCVRRHWQLQRDSTSFYSASVHHLIIWAPCLNPAYFACSGMSV